MLCQECHFTGQPEDPAFVEGLGDHPVVVHTLRPTRAGIQLVAHYIGQCSACQHLVLVDNVAWELKRPVPPVEVEELTSDETPPEKAN